MNHKTISNKRKQIARSTKRINNAVAALNRLIRKHNGAITKVEQGVQKTLNSRFGKCDMTDELWNRHVSLTMFASDNFAVQVKKQDVI